MRKAITLVALASVAMTAEFEDENLNVFKSIGNGLKNAGKFVVEHPKIITTAAKIIALEDEEFFKIADLKNKEYIKEHGEKLLHTVENDIHKVKEFAARHPEVVEKVHDLLKKYKDGHALKTDIKHGLEKIVHNPEILAHTAEAIKKFHAAHKHQIQADDEELFNHDALKKFAEGVKKGIKYAHEHPEVVQDGVNIVKDIKHKDTRQLIHDGIKTLQDLGFSDEELELLSEEEFFKIGKVVKNVAHGVKKGAEFVGAHPALIKDGANIIKDVKTHNYGQLIKDGIKTYKDARADDDEELFNLKKTIHNIGNGIKKGADFVGAHPALIKDGANIVKDVKTHNYGQLLKDGIKAYKDAHADDEELFNIKNAAHKVGHVVKTGVNYGVAHPQVVKDGLHLVKDIKNKDIKGAVKDGFKLYKDVHADDEELFNKDLFKKIAEDVKKGVKYAQEHPEVVQDGVNIVKDIKQKDTRQLIHDGIKTLQDLGFADEELELLSEEELFKIGKVVKNIGNGIKKGVEFVGAHPALIKDGANIVKDVKTHNYGQLIKDGIKTYKDARADDDEELFNLKKTIHNIGNGIKKGAEFVGSHPALIKDGANIVKDVKSHNYGQLLKDGIKAYKDAHADDEELFSVKNAAHKVGHAVKTGVNYGISHPQVVKDGLHLAKDIKNKDIKGAVKDGFKLYKDIKADDEEFFAFEDEELFSLKNTIHKGADFVKSHPAVIRDGVNIVKDVKNKNVVGLIKDGIKTYKDIRMEDEEFFAFEDEELFSIKKTVHDVAHGVKKGAEFVGSHPALIKDGANIVKDVKTKNVGGLIKDGFKTYKDLGFEDSEFAAVHAFKDLGFEDQTDNNLFSLGELIKDGKKIKEDVKSHNVKDLIKDGSKIIKDAKEIKKFLF